MEEIRAQAVTKLGELQKVVPKSYSAMELHPRRAMLGRIERQERRRYYEEVQKRKVKLKKDIVDIDKYLASVKARDEFFASLPPVENGIEPMGLPFQAPELLPAPKIVFGPRPMFRPTRFEIHRRRGRL